MKLEEVEAFPLTWPAGRPRTKHRKRAVFHRRVTETVMICSCGWTGTDRECRWATPESLGLTMYKGYIKDPDGRDGGPYLAVCPSCISHDNIFLERLSVGDERRYFELCGVPWAEPADRKEVV